MSISIIEYSLCREDFCKSSIPIRGDNEYIFSVVGEDGKLFEFSGMVEHWSSHSAIDYKGIIFEIIRFYVMKKNELVAYVQLYITPEVGAHFENTSNNYILNVKYNENISKIHFNTYQKFTLIQRKRIYIFLKKLNIGFLTKTSQYMNSPKPPRNFY